MVPPCVGTIIQHKALHSEPQFPYTDTDHSIPEIKPHSHINNHICNHNWQVVQGEFLPADEGIRVHSKTFKMTKTGKIATSTNRSDTIYDIHICYLHYEYNWD